jgi:hypothetical protein
LSWDKEILVELVGIGSGSLTHRGVVCVPVEVEVAEVVEVVDVVLSVLEVVEVSLVVVAEVAVVEEAAADGSVDVDKSEVVDASTLEGAVVVDCSVVFASVLPVVFASVVDESALFFNSSCSSAAFSSWHSCANQTAPTAASASEHPPPTKHFSISPRR